MSSENRPLLSTVPTRQSYLAFPENVDPFYHPTSENRPIHRCSSFSQSIREVGTDDENEIQENRRMSKDSCSIETLLDGINDPKRMRQPTDSVAYVQRLEHFFNKFSTSLYLENNVAVARDHLANERTFLAWVRTSLSTISIGVAITQLFRLDKSILKDPAMADDLINVGRPLGMCFIGIGMLYMVFAAIRYFHSQAAMTKGYFPASRGIVIVTTTATLSALIAVFIIIIQKN